MRMEPTDDSLLMESLQKPLAPEVATLTLFSRIPTLMRPEEGLGKRRVAPCRGPAELGEAAFAAP